MLDLRKFSVLVAVATLLTGLTACSGGTTASGAGEPCTPSDSPTLTFLAYSTPQDVYDSEIIPAFKAKWKEEHDGQIVNFYESYGASTTQAQNVVNGQEADVVALSLDPDVQMIADAGLITHDWHTGPDGGMVSSSVVVFDVRPGNPKNIKDWNDLAASGIEILTPDPAQSGGARWNQVALWGAAVRGDVPGVIAVPSSPGDDSVFTVSEESFATQLVQQVNANVVAYDSSARNSIQNFEDGNGDVAITYENEVMTAKAAGKDAEAVYPKSTVQIENPVAIVDQNVDAHCVRDVAEAFVEFLHSDEAKQAYVETGFLRPVDFEAAKAGDPANGYPAIDGLFTVKDLGGWDSINSKLFGDSGIVTQAIAGEQG